MTQQYDNNLSGVLFKNDKGNNEKRPDYKGSAEIEGVHYWVSSWIRDGAKGKFMSMKYEKKEQQPAGTNPQVSQQAAPPDFDEDIPFAPAHYLTGV